LGLVFVLAVLAATGFLISCLTGYLLRQLAPRWGWMDQPGDRKIHVRPIPTSGGLAIWLGVVVPLAVAYGAAQFWVSWGHQLPWLAPIAQRIPSEVFEYLPGFLSQGPRLWAMLLAATVLCGLGFWDDRVGLDWRFRLGVQTAVAVAMVALGWRATLFLPGSALPNVLSVLWIVALINCFNMLDNMDGLAAGVAAIAALFLAAVMFLAGRPDTAQPQWFVGGFLVLLASTLVGFLVHNWPPARLFMGDAGSYFVGFLMAMMSLAATFAGDSLPAHSILAPVCILAIPLYDMTTVILIRVRSGRSPFIGDKSHFSHRLVELGLSPLQAVLTIWLATATCGLGALVLHQVRLSGAVMVLLIVLCMLVLIRILEAAGGRRSHP
jgi:UDP-GlcNAc:undecaprenyl-phosphate GlcNAc-1-phosphate transferase